jgi:hypothetical protein
MQGSQLSQCSIIRNFFLSGARIAKSAAYDLLHFLGAPRKLPDCRIDKTPRQL